MGAFQHGGTPLARDRGKRVVDGGTAAVYHTLSPNHESAPPEMECTHTHWRIVPLPTLC
jgi:hypothetical protein